MHRVVDVDVALCVLANAVRVAVFDVRRQFAPVVDAFVFVIAFAQDRVLLPGLVISLDERGYGANCASYQKTASSRVHSKNSLVPD